MQKIPYMLVIGDREMDAGQISPRRRDGENLGAMTAEDFIALVKEQCEQHQ
jgi:threonyl-tRNA synthetase